MLNACLFFKISKSHVMTMPVVNNEIPVKLNCVLAVNADETQCTDFLVVKKLNYYDYLSSEIMLKIVV